MNVSSILMEGESLRTAAYGLTGFKINTVDKLNEAAVMTDLMRTGLVLNSKDDSSTLEAGTGLGVTKNGHSSGFPPQ